MVLGVCKPVVSRGDQAFPNMEDPPSQSKVIDSAYPTSEPEVRWSGILPRAQLQPITRALYQVVRGTGFAIR